MASAEPVRRYTDEEANSLLERYREIFPKEPKKDWDALARYWDFGRTRRWSCSTTDFHAVSLEQIRALDAARRAWRPAPDASPEQNGEALARLAREHGCGYSIGINRWTDSGLHDTVRPDTRELIALVGHDRYPIVERGGNIDDCRLPLNIHPLLDSPDPRRGGGYAKGIPSAEHFRRAKIGLLYLNLVPDFRPPNTSAEGKFRFEDPDSFGYPHCAKGLREALKVARTSYHICHVVTWSKYVWKALREFAEDKAVKKLRVKEAAKRGEADGFPWLLGEHILRIHPFPHTVPGRQSLNWTTELWEAYRKMWNGFLKDY
jgi:hypothetical protein